MHGALRPGAAFGHGVAAVLHGRRLVIAGPPLREVGLAQQAAVALARGVAHGRMCVIGVDLVGDEAFVPDMQRGLDAAAAVPAGGLRLFHDARVGGRDAGRAEQGVRRRRAAIAQPDLGRAGPFVAEQGLHRQDGLGDAWHQWKSVAGVGNGRREHVGQLPGAVVAQQREPGAEGARHGCRQQADAGHQVQTQTTEIGRRRQRGRGSLAA